MSLCGAELRSEGGAPVFLLLSRACGALSSRDFETAGSLAKESLEIAWDHLHIGPWRDIPHVWRRAYGLSGLILSGN